LKEKEALDEDLARRRKLALRNLREKAKDVKVSGTRGMLSRTKMSSPIFVAHQGDQ